MTTCKYSERCVLYLPDGICEDEDIGKACGLYQRRLKGELEREESLDEHIQGLCERGIIRQVLGK